MTKWFIYLRLTYFIIIINQSLQAKFVLKIHLFNYKNNDDLLYNGKKCESFYWAGDYCDPIFQICVTSTKKCDIINSQTEVRNNEKVIYNVFRKEIYVNSLQKSISVDTTIDDLDSYKLENIAKLQANFQLAKIPYSYSQKMQVLSQNKNVFLQASIEISCSIGFIGDFCEYSIDEYQCIKRCVNGKCKINQKKENYNCVCHLNWKGYNCDSFINPTTLSSVLMKKLSSTRSMETTNENTFPSSLSDFITILKKYRKISTYSINSFVTSKLIILNSSSKSRFAFLPSFTSIENVKSLIKSTKRTIKRNSTKSSTILKILNTTETITKKILDNNKSNTKFPLKTNFQSESTETIYTSDFIRNNKNKSKNIDFNMITKNSYSDLIKKNKTNFKTTSFTDLLISNSVKKISVFQTEIPYSNATNISTENNVIIQERSTKASKINRFDYAIHNFLSSISWNKTNKHYSDLYTDSSNITPFKPFLKLTNRKSSEFQLTPSTKSINLFHKIIDVNNSTYRPVSMQVPITKSSPFNKIFTNTKVVLSRIINLHKSTLRHKRQSSVFSNEILNSSKKQLTTVQKIQHSKSNLSQENISLTKDIFSTTSSSKYKKETEIQIVIQKTVKNKKEKSSSIAEKLTMALQTIPKVIFICFSAWLLMIILLIIIIILKVKKRRQIREKRRSNKSIKSTSPKDNSSSKLNKKENTTVKSLSNKSFSKYESILLNLDNQNREIP